MTTGANPQGLNAGVYAGGIWEIPATSATLPAHLLARASNWPGALTFAAITSDAEAVATNAQDVCIRRFVSEPLVGAQTISGTIKGQIRISESSTNMNALPQICVKVIANDGQSVVGVLFTGDTRTTNVDELTTAVRNQKIPAAGISPATLSSVAAGDGDRIYVEVGVRANNTSSTSFTATARAGATATPGGANDLTEGGAETTDLNPWIEFSQALNFDPLATGFPFDPHETLRSLMRR